MMKTLLTTLTGVALLGLSSCCAAALINDTSAGLLNGTDVGELDYLFAVGEQDGNSNPDTETAWVNSVLPIVLNATYTVKTEDVEYYNTTETGVYAFALSDPNPDYFLVKNATNLALFQNNLFLDWGVFDISTLEGFNLGTDFTISHVIQFDVEFCEDGCDRTVVPIPASVYLMGTGLLGLVGVARRNPKV